MRSTFGFLPCAVDLRVAAILDGPQMLSGHFPFLRGRGLSYCQLFPQFAAISLERLKLRFPGFLPLRRRDRLLLQLGGEPLQIFQALERLAARHVGLTLQALSLAHSGRPLRTRFLQLGAFGVERSAPNEDFDRPPRVSRNRTRYWPR